MRWPSLGDAVRHCKKFLQLNKVPPPRFEPHRVLGRVPAIGSRDLLGQYVTATRTVHLYEDLCATSSSPWVQWTLPGFKSDLSVFGVTAHECGHHFMHTTGRSRAIREAIEHCRSLGEPGLTTYAHMNLDEDFCEAFKLFVTNPSLLEMLRPVRYSLLAHALELRPVETRGWREVLASSEPHLRICDAASEMKREADHIAIWVMSAHECPEEYPSH